MITEMYSVYDKKALIFHPPAFCHNAAHARRFFMGVMQKENVFTQFPSDFQVYLVGTFNDSEGIVSGCFDNKPVFQFELSTLFDEGEKNGKNEAVA